MDQREDVPWPYVVGSGIYQQKTKIFRPELATLAPWPFNLTAAEGNYLHTRFYTHRSFVIQTWHGKSSEVGFCPRGGRRGRESQFSMLH